MHTTHGIKFAALESERFGLKIYRGELPAIDIAYIKEVIIGNKADVLILRLPVETKAQHHLLLNTGFRVLHCDTLVYYFCSLVATQVQSLRNNITFEVINEKDTDILDELVGQIFTEYRNHYFSNPVFEKRLINEGYQQWAKSFLHEKEASQFSWFVKLNEKIVGFVLCSIISNNTCEGVLYGVKHEFSGKGIYSDMIRFSQQFFKDKGLKKMLVSTQIQNYSVQKVWLKEGFNLKYALDTYHINSFLSQA